MLGAPSGRDVHIPENVSEIAALTGMPAEHQKRRVYIAPVPFKTSQSGYASAHLWTITWGNRLVALFFYCSHDGALCVSCCALLNGIFFNSWLFFGCAYHMCLFLFGFFIFFPLPLTHHTQHFSIEMMKFTLIAESAG